MPESTPCNSMKLPDQVAAPRRFRDLAGASLVVMSARERVSDAACRLHQNARRHRPRLAPGAMLTENAIVVQRDGADRRAEREKNVADAPSRWIRIVRVVAVVRDDVALNFFQAFRGGFDRPFRPDIFSTGPSRSTFPAYGNFRFDKSGSPRPTRVTRLQSDGHPPRIVSGCGFKRGAETKIRTRAWPVPARW